MNQRDIALLFAGNALSISKQLLSSNGRGHATRKRRLELGSLLFTRKNGEQFFKKLNGLFSGLLIDKRQKKAILFNDRYGIERIYYYETQGNFYFASEAKALLRILPELRAFDEEGVAQFLAFGCTLNSRTLFRGVRLLPSASVWSFEAWKV